MHSRPKASGDPNQCRGESHLPERRMRRTQSWRFWRFSRRRKSTKSTTFCPDHSEAPLAGAIQILRFPQLHYSATYRFLQLCLPSITPFRINLLSSLNPRQLAACSTSRMTQVGQKTRFCGDFRLPRANSGSIRPQASGTASNAGARVTYRSEE